MKKGILLIGMPGCGKTTLGKSLAKMLGYDFVDMDDFIELSYGKTINELFLNGEENFRNKESESCKLLSKSEKIVIASGGGIIKRRNNMDLFKNFSIVFINRPLELISKNINTDSRPLLKNNKEKLVELYRERIDLYNEYKDIEIVNDGEIEEILKELEDRVRRDVE